MRHVRRCGLLLALALAVPACGPADYSSGWWRQTRHGAPGSGSADAVIGAANTGVSIAAPGPPFVVLCNADDDNGDKQRDLENGHIDGLADADDLMLIRVMPVVRSTDRSVRLVLDDGLPPRPLSPRAPVRIFDRAGGLRLGRGGSREWVLDSALLERLQTEPVDLLVEGCTFGASARVEIQVGGATVGVARLQVAPLLLPPRSHSVERVYIQRHDIHGKTRDLLKSFEEEWGKALASSTVGEDAPALVVPVEVGTDMEVRDMFLQDECQWAYTRTPFATMPVAIHLPRGAGAAPWVKGLLGPNVGYVAPLGVPVGGEDRFIRLYGGNLEETPVLPIAPLGYVVHGSLGVTGDLGNTPGVYQQMLEKLLAFLEARVKQPLLQVDAGAMYVEHVDELFAPLPHPTDEGRMLLLAVSPKAGVEILKNLPEPSQTVPEEIVDEYRYRLGEPASGPYTWDYVLGATPVGTNTTTLESYNLALHEQLYGPPSQELSGGLLHDMLKSISEDWETHVEVVRIPAFFYPAKVVLAGEPHGRAIALLPNMVNLVNVRGHLLVSDPLLCRFKAALLEAIPGASDASVTDDGNVHFIDVFDYLHAHLGGLHCGTNTQYGIPEATPGAEEGP